MGMRMGMRRGRGFLVILERRHARITWVPRSAVGSRVVLMADENRFRWKLPLGLLATGVAGAAVLVFRGCWHRKMSWPVRYQQHSSTSTKGWSSGRHEPIENGFSACFVARFALTRN